MTPGRRVTASPRRPAVLRANRNFMLKGMDGLHGGFTGSAPTDDFLREP